MSKSEVMLMKEDKRLAHLIESLRASKKGVWKRIAHFLGRSKRQRVAVNLSKISKVAKEGEVIVVPGKVLGDGSAPKAKIAAYSFSDMARKKLMKEGAEILEIEKLYSSNKEGKGIRIVI
ncbi:MAG: 50S ribosomal protein L18e [Candidatus Anstonellales archaeon]